MEYKSLEQIIKQYVHLQPPNHKGWHAVRCHVCNDHTRKGLRGSFLFDNDTVVYKCFNCGHVAKYDPNIHETMPKKMVRVLNDFNVPEDEWRECVLLSPAYTGKVKNTKENKKHESIEPKEIPLPSYFYFLNDADKNDKQAIDAIKYLESRNIDPNSYPFMLSHKAENPRLHKWLGRIIMPIYKNNKLIYYIGRSFYPAVKKYETPAFPKEKVLYGFDRLFEYTNSPLLVVEGWFDAFAVDGVATLGNVISKYQKEWLNRSKREKIYIPDRFGDGKRAAEQALEFGWYISTPDIGSECKDMSDAVSKYGKLYVLKSILENKAKGFKAELQLSNYCR